MKLSYLERKAQYEAQEEMHQSTEARLNHNVWFYKVDTQKVNEFERIKLDLNLVEVAVPSGKIDVEFEKVNGKLMKQYYQIRYTIEYTAKCQERKRAKI